jgi:magnesium transporter
MIKTYFYQHAENATYHDIDLMEKDELLADPHNLLWIDLYECTEAELNYVGELFDFHPLALEDCMQISPRAKVDNYEDYYFFVFHAIKYDEDTEEDEITNTELDVFLGANYIVTIHPVTIAAVGNIARVSMRSPTYMNQGTGYLLYSMMDGIVDEIFPILDSLGSRIDELEDDIYEVGGSGTEVMEEISALRRNIILMRKVLIPQRTIFSNMRGKYSFFGTDETVPYYLDLADHLNNILDSINAYRDLVHSSYEVYFTLLTSRTNEIITILTLITVIMMPLTVITGFYGMNVTLPGSEHAQAVWVILAGMTALSAAMVGYFKHRKWM